MVSDITSQKSKKKSLNPQGTYAVPEIQEVYLAGTKQVALEPFLIMHEF
jgi:hypothetical protein